MRFLFIGSRFTLHASFPRPVTLTQLRFTSLAVTSSWRDLHPQVCAHAGRTRKRRPAGRRFLWAKGRLNCLKIRQKDNELDKRSLFKKRLFRVSNFIIQAEK
jgi:hypothetical protein